MIFYLVGPLYPFRGGIAQYLEVLGEKLQARGHRVKGLSFRKQFPRLLFPGRTQLETAQRRFALDAEPVFIPWNPITWWKTFRRVRKGKPDALIFKYWMPFFAPGFAVVCALTRRFTDTRVIFILDNVIPHERRPGDRLLTRMAFKRVDGFIVQSEVVRRDLLNWFPEAENRRVVLVPHPVYDCYGGADLTPSRARERLHLDPDEAVILFFGLVRHYKGLDILLQAMPEIVRRLSSKVHLIVAGEFYDSADKYRRIVTDLNLTDAVTIVNQYIPNDEVALYFRAADLLVLPYRSATQSGVIQVAESFHLPVISTRVGGLPEMVREGVNGILVPPEDPQRLAAAVVDYFQSGKGEEMRGKMRERGDGWDRLTEALEGLADQERNKNND